MNKPLPEEYAPYCQTYIDYIDDGDILKILSKQANHCANYFETFADKGDHRYADDKWTVKQLLQHIIDAERVFSYRVLRISRRDTTPIAGFDENDYAAAAPVDHRSVEELTTEFMAVRSGTHALLNSLQPEQWTMSGVAGGSSVSVRAIAYIIAGHCAHHIAILAERYN